MSIDDIPDFPGLPGQRPQVGAAPTVGPLDVVLVAAPLDPGYTNIALNADAVDTFIATEIAAGRAWQGTVERWSPWDRLQLPLTYAEAAPFNYARMSIGGRYWYAFLSVDYLNYSASGFGVQGDVWTTYGPTLGYSMIERGHVAVAASQNDTYGDQYLTAPEPIEAPPVRGILSAPVLASHPDDWTVLVISANDLRGGTGFAFWDRHVEADEIGHAADLASSATIDSAGHVQQVIPDAHYPWTAYVSPTDSPVVDTISPGHSITNPGGTIASGWQWHIDNNDGRGGDDWNYDFQTFTAPAAGTVDHFDVAGVGMVVRLTLDTPAPRTSARQPHGDQPGPMVAIWFQHCSAAIDGHANEGDVIGTSGDGYGQYPPHLHVHGATDHSKVSGATNRCCFWGFLAGGAEPFIPDIFVPKVEASEVSTIDGVSAGGGAYLFTLDGFAQYMTIMQGAPWVLSGISDVRLVPSWCVSGGGDATFNGLVPTQDPSDDMWNEAAAIPEFRSEVVSANASPSVLAGWRSSVLSALDAGIYKKLLTAQFTDLIVGNGDSMRSFRPDQWHDSDVQFTAVSGAAHGDPTIRLIPVGYNDLGSQLGIDGPVGGKAGLAHTGFGLAASQVANQDLAPYQAAYGSQLNWLGALKNRELAISLGLEQIQLNAGVQGISTVLGAAAGAAGGALGGGGGAGAIAGAASSAIGAAGSLATAGIQAQNAITMIDMTQDGSFDIVAIQLGMSGVLSVKSFDTWFQSLSSVSGSGSPESLASAWRAILGQAFHVIISVPTAERVSALLSEWDRYGYMVGQSFKPSRLDAMTHRTYWKTADATILGRLPQADRETIAAAFDAGVTVWNKVSEIGTHSANDPTTGITY